LTNQIQITDGHVIERHDISPQLRAVVGERKPEEQTPQTEAPRIHVFGRDPEFGFVLSVRAPADTRVAHPTRDALQIRTFDTVATSHRSELKKIKHLTCRKTPPQDRKRKKNGARS